MTESPVGKRTASILYEPHATNVPEKVFHVWESLLEVEKCGVDSIVHTTASVQSIHWDSSQAGDHFVFVTFTVVSLKTFGHLPTDQ